jgi:hypothetical protein
MRAVYTKSLSLVVLVHRLHQRLLSKKTTDLYLGVGKSSLARQFASHIGTEQVDSTPEVTFRKDIILEGNATCTLEMYLPDHSKLTHNSLDSSGEQSGAVR